MGNGILLYTRAIRRRREVVGQSILRGRSGNVLSFGTEIIRGITAVD